VRASLRKLPTGGDKVLDDVYALLLAITQRMPSKLKELLDKLETDLFGPAKNSLRNPNKNSIIELVPVVSLCSSANSISPPYPLPDFWVKTRENPEGKNKGNKGCP
jgi:hypothetical protein